ncbi:MAG: DMT family transporter [Ignavibacteria bacterium]|nr:DMT family transporter [Ignavibacteria bacterium]
MTNKEDLKLSQKYFGEAALLIMTIIWGGTFPLVKESLNDISSQLFVSIRFGIAAIIVAIFFWTKKYRIEKKAVLPGIFLGFILFCGFLFQTNGLRFTSATKSGFITGTLVVMIPFFQTVIEKKFPTKGAQIGTVLVFIGLIFLSSGGSSLSNFLFELGDSFNFGDWLTLLCAASFALHVVYIDIISPKYDFWNLFFMQLITVTVLSFFASLILHVSNVEGYKFIFTSDLVTGLLYTAIFATCVNFGIQTKYQKVVSPTKAGIIYSFEPIFAAIFAFFLLSEKITNFGLAGCVLIFFGLVATEVLDNFFNGSKN